MKLAIALCMITCAAIPALALPAPPQITWVASYGSDSNFCSRTSPCATFQHAHDVTAFFGIVKAVDAADYGVVTITKSITLDGNGTGAEITAAPNVNAIWVNGSSTDQVNIYNLTINARYSAGFSGILASSNTYIENVVVWGDPYYGVRIAYNGFAPTVVAKNLTVSGAFSFGVFVGGGSLALRDSAVTHSDYGVWVASDGAGHGGTALIERSEISFNGTQGLRAEGLNGGALVRLSDSVITGNGTGIFTADGGQIITFRTNMLAGNTTDGSTPFSISLK
jgi:hypothetical protein